MIPAETIRELEQQLRRLGNAARAAANETSLLQPGKYWAAEGQFRAYHHAANLLAALLADSGRPPEPQCTPEEFAAQQREREANGALFDAGFRAGLTFTGPPEPRAGGSMQSYLDEVAARIIEMQGACAHDWLVGVAKQLQLLAKRQDAEPRAGGQEAETLRMAANRAEVRACGVQRVRGDCLHSACETAMEIARELRRMADDLQGPAGGARKDAIAKSDQSTGTQLAGAGSPAAAPTKKPSMEWQPIETAPKDGTRVLAFLGDTFHVCVLSWDWDDHSDREAWVDAEEFATDPQPTHWMPLPDPPLSPAAERKTKE